MLASAAGALILTAVAAFVDPSLAKPGDPQYITSGGVMTLADLLLALGLSALVVQALRGGWFKLLAGGLLVIGSFAVVPAEVTLRVNFDLGNSVFGIIGPIQAAGLILCGIGVIRSGRWSSWRRFTPLIFGLYVPAVMVPALIASHGGSLAALAGYHACVLLTGLAFLVETGGPSRVSVKGLAS
jgi:hypothetical protein